MTAFLPRARDSRCGSNRTSATATSPTSIRSPSNRKQRPCCEPERTWISTAMVGFLAGPSTSGLKDFVRRNHSPYRRVWPDFTVVSIDRQVFPGRFLRYACPTRRPELGTRGGPGCSAFAPALRRAWLTNLPLTCLRPANAPLALADRASPALRWGAGARSSHRLGPLQPPAVSQPRLDLAGSPEGRRDARPAGTGPALLECRAMIQIRPRHGLRWPSRRRTCTGQRPGTA